MNDPRKVGKKKHPAEELHFKAASELEEANEAEVSDLNAQDLSEDLEPIEEKIQDVPTENEELSFEWNPMDTAKRSGLPVFLSKDGKDFGTLAFWKRTRAFANPTKKWEITGKWMNFMTAQEIDFSPKYWRERV